MAAQPLATVVVPTRNRARYLRVALDSLASQELEGPFEVIVVDDRSTDETAEVAARQDVQRVRLDPGAGGLNAARNAGIRAARSDLIALVDDDVIAPPGWLAAVIAGAARYPGADAFGGPIRARLEGRAPRGCGREGPPITTLDLGPEDRAVEVVWGANMALRRAAVERVGEFDVDHSWPHGDEEEWLQRLHEAEGSVMYLADAGLEHLRVAEDARLRSLARAAYTRGRGARASDRRHGRAPSLGGELRVLAGCGWHTVRRACPQGLIMGAHSAGRVRETLGSG
jgi:glycosyltransferase involved in cell wall biosynthesis